MDNKKRGVRSKHLVALATRGDYYETGTPSEFDVRLSASLAPSTDIVQQELTTSVQKATFPTAEEENIHGNTFLNTFSSVPPLESDLQETFVSPDIQELAQNRTPGLTVMEQQICTNQVTHNLGKESTFMSPAEGAQTSVQVMTIAVVESENDPFEDIDMSDDDATYVPESISHTSSDASPERLVNTQNSDNEVHNDNVPETLQSSENVLKPFARKLRKLRTTALHTYSTPKGKQVPSRKIRDLRPCRNKCYTELPQNVREALFNEYWSLGSIEKRRTYVASHINTQPKKTLRLRDDREESKNRQVTHTYHFTVNGKRIKVCKACFSSTLDETGRFLRTVVAKKSTSISGVPDSDGRGKHPPPFKHPPHSIEIVKNHILSFPSYESLPYLQKSTSISGVPDSDGRGKHPPPFKHPPHSIEIVKNHILSFPSYESHYTRRTNDKKYLPTSLTQQMMYDLYCEKEEKPVSKRIYYEMFHSLKLSIKKPKQDTCHKCDTLVMQKKAAQSEDEKNRIDMDHKNHIESADVAYLMKKRDNDAAKNSVNIKCYTFDLQQCLATPMLASSVSFYKRQLWTFNLTVHDGATGQSYNYMWHEALAGHGANEIASCIYHFLSHEVPSSVSEVTFYSDTYGGQNKNSHVAVMFLKFVEESNHINIINHKFLVPGHTHMECDVDHALIEKQKKKIQIPI